MAVLLETWLLVVACKYLLSLDIAAPAMQLPGVGYGDWLGAGFAQAVVQVAVPLGLVALHWACTRAFAPKPGTVGFVRYHVERLLIRRFLLLMRRSWSYPILIPPLNSPAMQRAWHSSAVPRI